MGIAILIALAASPATAVPAGRPASGARALPIPASVANAGVGHATVDTLVCYGPYAIGSVADNSWVSAELSDSGFEYAMLRARAATAGPWEQYDICLDSNTGTISFKSVADGLWVSAELGYGGGDYAMLRARATTIGSWEQFNIGCTNGVFYIQSVANGDFVSAELGYAGGDFAILRARTTPATIGTWEQFVVPGLCDKFQVGGGRPAPPTSDGQ